MPLRRPPAAVIFDLDGVLLDTEPLYTQAVQEIVGRWGKVFDWPVKLRTLGRGAEEGARILLSSLDVPLDVGQYLEERDRRLAELFGEARELPGARDFVAKLVERGLALAVATSSSRAQYRQKTAHHAWFEAFRVVVCGDDPEVVQLKPAPDIFLVAASRLGVVPAECLVVEDAPAGVEAARAAGMRVLALPDRAVDRTQFAGADLILGGYAELRFSDLGLSHLC
jgi:pseudouridine 5'-phosphatase